MNWHNLFVFWGWCLLALSVISLINGVSCEQDGDKEGVAKSAAVMTASAIAAFITASLLIGGVL